LVRKGKWQSQKAAETVRFSLDRASRWRPVLSKKSEKIRFFLLSLFCIPFFMSPAVFALDIKYIGGSGSTNIDCLDSNYNLDVTCGSGNTTASGKIEKRGPSGACYGAGGNTTVPGSCFTGKYTCCGATAQERIERCSYEPTTDQYECLGSPGTVSCGQLNETLGYDCSDPVLLDATGSPSGTGPMPGCCAVGEDGNQTHLQCTPFEDVYRCDEIPGCAKTNVVVSTDPSGLNPEDGGCCSDDAMIFEYPLGSGSYSCMDCWPDGTPDPAVTPYPADGPTSAADCCGTNFVTIGGNGYCGNQANVVLTSVSASITSTPPIVPPSPHTGWSTPSNTFDVTDVIPSSGSIEFQLTLEETGGALPPSITNFGMNDPSWSISTTPDCESELQDGTAGPCTITVTPPASASGTNIFDRFELTVNGNTDSKRLEYSKAASCSSGSSCMADSDCGGGGTCLLAKCFAEVEGYCVRASTSDPWPSSCRGSLPTGPCDGIYNPGDTNPLQPTEYWETHRNCNRDSDCYIPQSNQFLNCSSSPSHEGIVTFSGASRNKCQRTSGSGVCDCP
jgi:hypothetical protein